MIKSARIIKSESAQFYETNFSCDNAIVLTFGDEKYFITDGRYTTEARENAKETKVIESDDLIADARKLLRLSGEKRFVVDPSEWSAKECDALRKKLPNFVFCEKVNFHQKLRAVKSASEIALIENAVKENQEAFDRFANFIAKSGGGKSEKELWFEAKRFLSDSGARDLSFEPIFAIDANAAKPHALPTNDKLKSGSAILFDAGTKYRRYCSDRTRTAVFDKNGVSFKMDQRFGDPKKQAIYDLVLKAHDKAIAAARIGMKASELDRVAREVIASGGYGEAFKHSLGHGVGLDIHEEPFINKRSETTLKEGMIFTIEPGIYIAGEFGVRIEDIVALEKGGARVL
ncbi:MAG: M24 family metallopeptidase [Helicobacteraceae bacterium]|jgi:Xaa-Pro aminopeptidase|nr:M24 family metallopeptidase [Helicobacteraceae bacterium]